MLIFLAAMSAGGETTVFPLPMAITAESTTATLPTSTGRGVSVVTNGENVLLERPTEKTLKALLFLL